MSKLKITEIREKRFRTVHEKDKNGKRIKKQVQYTTYRTPVLASSGKRFLNSVIDNLIVDLVFVGSTFLIFIQNPNQILFLQSVNAINIGFMLIPFYYFFMEFFTQKTLGKMVTKTIVIDQYGEKPDLTTAITRNLIRLVPFNAFSFLFNLRGWHDKWSETYVVTLEEYEKLTTLLKEQSQPDNEI